MIDADLIDRLAEAVAIHIQPPIPLSMDFWDIATIAKVIKREPQVVRERMACLPSFPKAIRLPTKAGRAQPLYSAAEVMAWIRSYQEKH